MNNKGLAILELCVAVVILIMAFLCSGCICMTRGRYAHEMKLSKMYGRLEVFEEKHRLSKEKLSYSEQDWLLKSKMDAWQLDFCGRVDDTIRKMIKKERLNRLSEEL